MSDEGPQYTEENPFTKQQFLDGLKEGKFKKIVILTGAGISVSAGIPDFRSPGTGLYDNLKQYNLPFAEAIFTLDYFNEHPEAFYKLAESFLSLDKFDATPTHHFCKMLHDKGILKEYVT
jgi:NAD-dependent SIR2 family protein deacetylase